MSTNGHSHSAPPILLTIAGFDPSCGAGTAADLKTFAAHGCYGVAAITSLTVQNTQGVETVHNTPSAEVREQLEVLEGSGAPRCRWNQVCRPRAAEARQRNHPQCAGSRSSNRANNQRRRGH